MSPQPEPEEQRVSPTSPTTGASTLVLGVLGGIASGKSTVARALAGPDGRVLSADAEAHRVLAEPETRAFLRERFGPEVLTPDGVDRERLAQRIFDPEHGADDHESGRPDDGHRGVGEPGHYGVGR